MVSWQAPCHQSHATTPKDTGDFCRKVFNLETGMLSATMEQRIETTVGCCILTCPPQVLAHESHILLLSFLSYSTVGNRRFKVCIENFLQSYQKAKSRSRRSAVITNIITSIRSSSEMGGGFVRFQPSQSLWYEIGDKVARDKVGQALRDVLRCLKRESSNGVIAESAGTPTLNQQDQSDVPQMEEKEPTSITDNSSFTDSSSSDTFNESKPCAQSSSVTIAEHTGTWTRQKRSLSTATLGSMPPTTRPVHSYKKTKLDPDETCKSPRLNNDKLLPRKSLPVHTPNWKLQQDCISVLHQWKDPCPAAISFPRTNNPPDCFGAYDRDSDGLFEWFMNDV